MAGNRTIFDEPHYQSLEFLAAQALAEGNLATAFRFADRRCRILPMPESHSYVLRAETSFRMGAKTNAIADLVTALEITFRPIRGCSHGLRVLNNGRPPPD
jgi:hypothetical protein